MIFVNYSNTKDCLECGKQCTPREDRRVTSDALFMVANHAPTRYNKGKEEGYTMTQEELNQIRALLQEQETRITEKMQEQETRITEKMQEQETRITENLTQSLTKRIEEGENSLIEMIQDVHKDLDEKIRASETRINIKIENDITKRMDSLFDGYKLTHEMQWQMRGDYDKRIESLEQRISALEMQVG